MSKLINRELLLIKIEVTYGTDSAPVAGTDAILVENLSWSNEGLRFNERPAVRTSLGKLRQVFGGRLITMTFDVELKGSGINPSTTATPPELGVVLRACGFAQTINAGVSVVYQPASASLESVTIHYFEDGSQYRLVGCRGNVSFNAEAGALGKFSFTLTGHLTAGDPVDLALPTPTFNTTVPAPIIGLTSVSVGAFAACVNAITLDMSNTLAMPPKVSTLDGFGEVQITGRDVNGSIDPEADLVAAFDPHNQLETNASLALVIGAIGTVAGNIVNISLPAISYRDISPADRDAIRVFELPFGAAEVSGDDEIVFTFT